jgi:hypothetical protein
MDNALMIAIGLYVLWVATAGYISYRITFSEVSGKKKVGYIFFWTIPMIFLFGVPKGLAFLLISPFAIFLLPALLSKKINSDELDR